MLELGDEIIIITRYVLLKHECKIILVSFVQVNN